MTLPAAGPARPFVFLWSREAEEVIGEPPGVGDFLASTYRRTGKIGTLYQIVAARPVNTRDGARRMRYSIVRLDREAWGMLPATARIQTFVWLKATS